MEAKDTVIKMEEINDVAHVGAEFHVTDGEVVCNEQYDLNKVLQKQAEISFKAGYESGWNDNKPYLPDDNEPWDREQTVFEDGKKAGRQEGRKDVVEWLRQYAIHGGKIPLSSVIEDLETHSPYCNPKSRNGV